MSSSAVLFLGRFRQNVVLHNVSVLQPAMKFSASEFLASIRRVKVAAAREATSKVLTQLTSPHLNQRCLTFRGQSPRKPVVRNIATKNFLKDRRVEVKT